MDRLKLKRTVEAIEAAETAIKDLSAHKREVYAGVKDEFEPKVLRKIIQRRKMDPESRTKDDDLLDQYESALGMTGELAKAAASGDMTYQEAADKADVSRRTMARHVARARVPKATDNGATKPDIISPPEAATLPLAGTSIEQEAPAAGEGEDCGQDAIPAIRSSAPVVAPRVGLSLQALSTPPQPDACSTDAASAVARAVIRDTMAAMEEAAVPTPPLGAVAAEPRVASTESDPWDSVGPIPKHLVARKGSHRGCSDPVEGTQ